jgi:hypothetical protein
MSVETTSTGAITPLATTRSETASAAPHPRFPGRSVDGRLAVGHQETVTHGGRRRQPVIEPEQTELFVAYSTDLGGDLTTPQRALLRRFVETDAIVASAVGYLRKSREALTSKRVLAAVDVFLSASAQQVKLAQVLGLRRQQKHLDPMDALRRAVEAANEPNNTKGDD